MNLSEGQHLIVSSFLLAISSIPITLKNNKEKLKCSDAVLSQQGALLGHWLMAMLTLCGLSPLWGPPISGEGGQVVTT